MKIWSFVAGIFLSSVGVAGSPPEFETDWNHLPPARIDRQEETPTAEPIPVQSHSSNFAVPRITTTPDLKIDIFKKPRGLNVPREFMVVRLGDEVKSAHVISTATDGLVDGKPKNTPSGSYIGNIETAKVYTSATGRKSWRVDTAPGFEKFVGTLLDFPWHESSTYPKPNGGAPMYWAVIGSMQRLIILNWGNPHRWGVCALPTQAQWSFLTTQQIWQRKSKSIFTIAARNRRRRRLESWE